MKRFLGLILAVAACLTVFCMPTAAVSYTYDVKNQATLMPDAATVEKYMVSSPTEGYTFMTPADVATDADGNLYVCDSSTNEITVFDGDLEYSKILSSFTLPDGTSTTLTAPQGVFVDAKGTLYIADSEGGRVIVCDHSGAISRVITVSSEELYLTDFEFIPLKVAADAWGNVYILAKGVFDGLLQFNSSDDFIGFVGSNEVDASVIDVLWKKIATKRQREQYAKTVPVEFNNIDIDSKGFVYTVTASITNSPEASENVRKQTAKGTNILKTSELYGNVIGDLDFPLTWELATASGSSSFSDVSAASSYGFLALDSNHGRVFVYNDDSDLLFAIGGKGTVEGAFKKPTAIATSGDRIIVLDSEVRSITVFRYTDYGKAILAAQQSYTDGDYEQSVTEWKAVLKQNSNLRIGYSGIAKSYIMLGEYKRGMHYAKLADDQTTYSKAFKYYRKEALKDNFLWLLIGLAAVAGAAYAIARVLKAKRVGERLSASPVWSGISYSKYIATHPFKAFYEMCREGKGNLWSVLIIFVFYALVTICKSRYSAFLFTAVGKEFNLITAVCTAVVPVALWCVCNWAVSTLMEGDGTPLQITMATGYALVPFIIANLVYIPLTYCLTEEEAMFAVIIQLFGILWSGFLIFVAVITVHDFTLPRAIGTIIVTVVGMAIVIFLLLLVFNLVQQMAYFLISIYNQLIIRL